MRDDALGLGAIQLVEQPARHRHRGVRRIAARRERVRRRVLDDVELRRGDTQPDGERFDDVPQLGLLARPQLARPALREHELVAGEIGDPRRTDREEEREWHDRGAAAVPEILADEVREDHHDEHEGDEEHDGPHAIRRGGVVDREARGRGRVCHELQART